MDSCVICGKPISYTAQRVCSTTCKRIHLLKTQARPKPRPRIHTLDFDASSILQTTDNKLQVSFLCKILEGLDLSYDLDFELQGYRYDIHVANTNVLICADTTLTSNAFVLKDEPRLQRTRTLYADAFGYRCIHVFDWDDPIKVLASLASKQHISARSCQLYPVSKSEANLFYEMYHLNRSYNGRTVLNSYGLYYNDTLVMCMSFCAARTHKYDVELIRMCSDSEYQIHGGASMLFQYYVTQHHPDSVVAYCDRGKFTGQVFNALGFVQEVSNEPIKIWSKGIEAVSNLYWSPSVIASTLGIVYDTTISRDQVLLEHGWLPVYDCGKSRHVWRSK